MSITKNNKQCIQCGKCCLKTDYMTISELDINTWKANNREDLCDNVMLLEWDSFGSSGRYRNKTSYRCPFLIKIRNTKKYKCKLHNIKPIGCKQFIPGSKHAKQYCGCPA